MEQKNYDSPEEAAKRASQEDPIVMYLIVRESLGMSIGKTAAQCAHASQMLQLKFNEEFNEYREGDVWIKEKLGPTITIFQKWIDSSFRKVVLRADNKEWIKLKNAFPACVLVVDAGLTEIAAGSETVIGLWPMYKSQAPKVVSRLQVLK